PSNKSEVGVQPYFPTRRPWLPRDLAHTGSAAIVSQNEAIDALYALVLGRLPESNLIYQEDVGRPLVEIAEILIASEEFRSKVLDAFRWAEKLPHENLRHEDQQRAIAVARETGFHTANEDAGYLEWQAVLHAVFGAGPGYEMLHRHHGPAAGHFVTI